MRTRVTWKLHADKSCMEVACGQELHGSCMSTRVAWKLDEDKSCIKVA